MIRDTAYDPRTGETLTYTIEHEKHVVRTMVDLEQAVGFFIDHLPIPPHKHHQNQEPIVQLVLSYEHKTAIYSTPLKRVAIDAILKPDEYSLNTGVVHDDGTWSGERVGQLFVHPSLIGQEIVVSYHAKGTILHSANLAPLYYLRPPFSPHPKEIWLNSLWKREKGDGRLIRFEGGLATDFEQGLQQITVSNRSNLDLLASETWQYYTKVN